MKFALLFAARNTMPSETIHEHYLKIKTTVEKDGHELITMDSALTRNGGVETIEEAHNFAKFFRDNEGIIDGVIVTAMNFTEESATMIALRDCKVPILLNALADEMDKLDYYNCKAAFCGRLALMAMFKQFGIPFTAYTPHVCMPDSESFLQNIRDFAPICRVVNGMKRLRLGLIGSRPVSFKTVRTDEMTLQNYGITTECFDLTEVLYRTQQFKSNEPKLIAKKESLIKYADFSQFPEDKFDNYAKWALAIDDIIEEYELSAVAIRCWNEPQQLMGISVCQIIAELNSRGISASCEVDAMNAVAVHALGLATGNPATMVDWNHNYFEESNKCIISHCGNIPTCYMQDEEPKVHEHTKFAIRLGKNMNWGACNGFLTPMHVSFGSARTADGKIYFYCGEGDVTTDKISGTFYGCGGVLETPNLQENLLTIGKAGFRHHVSFTDGSATETLKEAFNTYLGYELMVWDR